MKLMMMKCDQKEMQKMKKMKMLNFHHYEEIKMEMMQIGMGMWV